MARDVSDDNPLTTAEQLDSDEVRNDDGDEVVDPPEEWIDAGEDETLDERLAEEVPDVGPDDIDTRDADNSAQETESMSDDATRPSRPRATWQAARSDRRHPRGR